MPKGWMLKICPIIVQPPTYHFYGIQLKILCRCSGHVTCSIFPLVWTIIWFHKVPIYGIHADPIILDSLEALACPFPLTWLRTFDIDINHSILLEHLEASFGVMGHPLQWLSAFNSATEPVGSFSVPPDWLGDRFHLPAIGCVPGHSALHPLYCWHEPYYFLPGSCCF